MVASGSPANVHDCGAQPKGLHVTPRPVQTAVCDVHVSPVCHVLTPLRERCRAAGILWYAGCVSVSAFVHDKSKQASRVCGLERDSAQGAGESGFVCEVDSVSMSQLLYMYLC